jgi:hypothetical protein
MNGIAAQSPRGEVIKLTNAKLCKLSSCVHFEHSCRDRSVKRALDC